MINTFCFENQTWNLVNNESYEVAPGVHCDSYEIVGNIEQDLAVIRVSSNAKTPKQVVMKGNQTIELFMKGEGNLIVEDLRGETHVFHFDESQSGEYLQVNIGEKMQWIAGNEGLQFAEICSPPYKEGRFVTVTDTVV